MLDRFGVIGRSLRRGEQDRLPQPHEACRVVRFPFDPIFRQTQRLVRLAAAHEDRDGDRRKAARTGHGLPHALKFAVGLGEAVLFDEQVDQLFGQADAAVAQANGLLKAAIASSSWFCLRASAPCRT